VHAESAVGEHAQLAGVAGAGADDGAHEQEGNEGSPPEDGMKTKSAREESSDDAQTAALSMPAFVTEWG
jgi:hypothetical protein